jgi:hypothetical protein
MKLLRAKPFLVSSCMSVPMSRNSADEANHEAKYGKVVVILHVV